MTLGQRIGVMRLGKFEQVGTPSDLYERPANVFVAGFVGSPRMNIVQGRVDDGGLVAVGGARLPLSPAAAARLREGDPVLVGIRPIDLEDAEFTSTPERPVIGVTVRVREYLGWATVLMVLMDENEPGHEVVDDEDAETEARSIDATHRSMMVAEVSPLSRARPGGQAFLAVDPGRLYFFDAETEELIAGPPQPPSTVIDPRGAVADASSIPGETEARQP
jgi:ABC-type sugar transport system ATPase subunit